MPAVGITCFRRGTGQRFCQPVFLSVLSLLLFSNAYASDFLYTGNSLELKSAPVSAPAGLSVYAGTEIVPDASMSRITINYDATNPGLTHPVNVFGGIGLGQEAYGNQVFFQNGNASKVYGGWSSSNNAQENTVYVQQGNIATLYGGYSVNGQSNNNVVIINGGRVENLYAGETKSGDIYNNRVIVNDGFITTRLWGGQSTTGNIYNNYIEINSGQIGNWVYGGWSTNGGNVTNNTIVIRDGVFSANSGFIGGGVVYSAGNAIDNTIIIDGSVHMPNYALWGGRSWGSGDSFSGNRLVVTSDGIAIKSAENFEFYDFYIPAAAIDGSVLLNVVNEVNVNGAKVEVKGIAPGSLLFTGDTVTLIEAGTINGTVTPVNTTVTQGISLSYDVDVTQTGNKIIATIVSVAETDSSNNSSGGSYLGAARVNPQTKALSEGRLAGLAFVTQGADLVSNEGIVNALNSVTHNKSLSAFGSIVGSTNRYNSGSHVDVDGVSMMAGIAYRHNALMIGGFIEGGWGNYDSYNSFINAANVHGKGDTQYYGAGLLMHYAFANGIYLEGSVRAGQTDTDFKSNDLISAAGVIGRYDSKTTYYGVHAGVGYSWSLNEQVTINMNTKYLWTHQNSDRVIVAGDPIYFASADSHRVRVAGQASYNLNTQVSLIGGLGYEYEFDGDANATTYHFYKLDTPSIGGGSGIGEFGVQFMPTSNQNLLLEFRGRGYVGQREGFNGSLQFRYIF